jgi:hypothetical protein
MSKRKYFEVRTLLSFFFLLFCQTILYPKLCDKKLLAVKILYLFTKKSPSSLTQIESERTTKEANKTEKHNRVYLYKKYTYKQYFRLYRPRNGRG